MHNTKGANFCTSMHMHNFNIISDIIYCENMSEESIVKICRKQISKHSHSDQNRFGVISTERTIPQMQE